ncbi:MULTISPECIES: hypothetical protein [unclassified Coleofasciculus]|uniref:hypothetical protein n=1 Tax=unclassified Coleofasciculus TaxID=2692782 RepID=UPI0018823234|nr:MULTISPECIES: hypothetical protein [unclassified Coleofasciculus]MBE9129237.1 hypothetical protein [Coleofasciculus sp. LEGE 07081]MBE9148252.1 hypothetical protein [Coleofasciculus sp. LEGE 07092]
MSEADTPNNQPLPEPTAPTDSSGADLSDVIESTNEPKLVHLFEGSEGNDISQQEPDPTPDQDYATIVEVEDDTTETFDDGGQERSKDADWFALAQKMRQRNRRLLDQVTQLKQALNEKQEALNVELVRSQDQELLVVRQNEEINTLQTQLTRLFHTLESSHQAAQRQQILIETLSEQLQSSQERVAQLERECALTQQRYNEQSHQLLQAANTCRELKTRLNRQQQQTLQFKVALEKCLEMPPNKATEEQSLRQSRDVTTPSVVPKAQPIQPWSAQPDLLEDPSETNTLWNRSIQLELLSNSSSEVTKPTTDWLSRTDTSEPHKTTFAASQDSTAAELEVEEQLLAEMTSLAEASGLSELVSDLVQEQGNLTPTLRPNSTNEPSASRDAEEIPSPDYPEAVAGDTANHELDESDEVILPQSNWPSPVLYPLRRPKKIKSLAAIELPHFPRY